MIRATAEGRARVRADGGVQALKLLERLQVALQNFPAPARGAKALRPSRAPRPAPPRGSPAPQPGWARRGRARPSGVRREREATLPAMPTKKSFKTISCYGTRAAPHSLLRAPRQDGSSQLYAQAADALDEMDAIELETWREGRTGQRHGDVAARAGAVTPGSTIGAFGGPEKVIDPGPARPHTAAALLGRAPRCGPRPRAATPAGPGPQRD